MEEYDTDELRDTLYAMYNQDLRDYVKGNHSFPRELFRGEIEKVAYAKSIMTITRGDNKKATIEAYVKILIAEVFDKLYIFYYDSNIFNNIVKHEEITDDKFI